MPQPARAVCVRGLTKRYHETTALDQLDLEVAAGELRGLLGPNGAGKTTLLRAMFGLVHIDRGSVELLGHPVGGRRIEPMEGVAGFVEEPAFYPYLSGRANLELLASLDMAGGQIDEALDRVGLGRRAGERVGGYSTGMRQRLGIAAALLRAPRLLLLDEPTSGLDPAGARAVTALLRELAADGVAVVVSSHLIGELEDICDAYTILRHGRVVWDGAASRLEQDSPGCVYLLSTSDDEHALALADRAAGVHTELADGGGIRLTARAEALDRYTRALGRSDLGIRRLELVMSSLESLFFMLTADGDSEQAGARPDAGVAVAAR